MKNTFYLLTLSLCLVLGISSCKSSKNSMTDTLNTNSPAVSTDTRTTETKEEVSQPKSRGASQRPSGIIDQNQINSALGLSEKQSEQMMDIQNKYRKQMDALRTKGRSTSDRAALMTEIKALRVKESEEIQSVLSKEQYMQYVEMKMEEGKRGPAKKMPRKAKDKMGKPGAGQAGKRPEKDRDAKFLDRLVKDMNLSRDQTADFYLIHEKYKQQFRESEGDINVMQRLEAGKTAEMKALLTEKQFLKYEAGMAQRNERRKKMSNRIKPNKNTQMEGGKVMRSSDVRQDDRWLAELEMDAEQTEKYKAINTKYKTQMKSIKGDRTQIMDGMKKIRSAKLAEMKALLTPDQFVKYTKILEEMKAKGMR